MFPRKTPNITLNEGQADMRLNTDFSCLSNRTGTKHISFFPTRQKERGLTIIELLVTVAIMGIVATTGGIHLMDQLPNYRLRGATRDLINTMQQARLTAVRNNSNTAVVFIPEDGTYSYCIDSGNDNKWETLGDNTCPKSITLSSYKSEIKYGHGDASVAISGSFKANNISYAAPPKVEFTPRGTANQSGYVYMENINKGTTAVGTITTGTILSKKWKDGQWVDM